MTRNVPLPSWFEGSPSCVERWSVRERRGCRSIAVQEISFWNRRGLREAVTQRLQRIGGSLNYSETGYKNRGASELVLVDEASCFPNCTGSLDSSSSGASTSLCLGTEDDLFNLTVLPEVESRIDLNLDA